MYRTPHYLMFMNQETFTETIANLHLLIEQEPSKKEHREKSLQKIKQAQNEFKMLKTAYSLADYTKVKDILSKLTDKLIINAEVLHYQGKLWIHEKEWEHARSCFKDLQTSNYAKNCQDFKNDCDTLANSLYESENVYLSTISPDQIGVGEAGREIVGKIAKSIEAVEDASLLITETNKVAVIELLNALKKSQKIVHETLLLNNIKLIALTACSLSVQDYLPTEQDRTKIISKVESALQGKPDVVLPIQSATRNDLDGFSRKIANELKSMLIFSKSTIEFASSFEHEGDKKIQASISNH